ncbi:uncharacterized protein UHOD_11129 [Ustilago sp. UG-2017b]|nr:uncharacterized protein UHOD_11129 [Ustilago sp. UG-2017b]
MNQQPSCYLCTQAHDSIECPVACLRPLSHGRPPLVPLFGLGPFGLDPLPRSTFITVLRRAIQACGLPASQYAGHSFHRGVATWASQHGTSTTDIQSLGRWSSDCYHRYIDRSAQECCALFPVAPPGEIQAWPDPGLLAPDPIETALSCAGASMTGLAGWELPSSSPRLDPRNLFSVSPLGRAHARSD